MASCLVLPTNKGRSIRIFRGVLEDLVGARIIFSTYTKCRFFFQDERVSRNFFMACRIFFFCSQSMQDFFLGIYLARNFFRVFGAAGNCFSKSSNPPPPPPQNSNGSSLRLKNHSNGMKWLGTSVAFKFIILQ